MPKKISTKCNVFLQLIILRPHPHFTGGQCMNMHRSYWPHRQYTVYMAVLYTKQGAVKLSQLLMKGTHRPHRLPQQTHIAKLLKRLIRYNDPVEYKGQIREEREFLLYKSTTDSHMYHRNNKILRCRFGAPPVSLSTRT